jgi:CubicO group peptidase (beta-lactamase class C family)
VPVADAPIDLCRPGALQKQLEGLVRATGSCSVSAGLFFRGQAVLAALGPDGPVPIGCIAKLLTSTLAGIAMAQGAFDPATRLSHLLAGTPFSHERFANITVKQLLDHTHGLDDSRITSFPHSEDGRLDICRFYSQMGSGRLHEPGRLCSYGSAGAWLIGAILERCFNRGYIELLHDELFAAIEVSGSTSDGSVRRGALHACPARGEALTLRSSDLLRFIEYQLTGPDEWCFGRTDRRALEQSVVPLAGWSPMETGIRLGWKYYGGGWFGHNSVLPGYPALLRVHPEHQVGFFVASTSYPASSIASALFGKTLPGYLSLRMPVLMSPAEAARQSLNGYAGTYANAATNIQITHYDESRLELRAFARNDSNSNTAPIHFATLRPAREEIFLLQPSNQSLIPFVQFIRSTSTGADYLWNGSSVWPRIANDPAAAPSTMA